MEIIEIGKVAKVMSSKRIFAKEYVADGIPFYRSKEVGELCRGQEVKTELFISESRYEEIKSKFEIPEKGDLLLTAVGSIGNTWIVDDRKFYYKDGNLTQIKPSEKLDVNFLNYFFKSSIFWNSISSNSTGTAYSALTISTLNKIKIPLPPLKTQQRIAGILDDAAALRDKTAQLLIEYDLLAQSVFLEMFGDPVINEKGWDKGTIRDLVVEAKYGTSSKAGDVGKFSYLRMNNITYSGYMDYEKLKYVDIPTKDLHKYIVKKGDILFNRTNSKELVGKTAVFDSETEMIAAGYLIRVRLNHKGNPYFVWGYLNSKHGKLILNNMCKSIVGMANINAQELQNIKILLPPIALQNQFAAKIALIEQQKALAKQELQESEDLFNCLLQQAFKGEL
jgi:type I restriction enzyme S subunit